MIPLRDACGDGTDSCPRDHLAKVWLVAHDRSLRWDAAGDEGDVVGGDVAVVVAVGGDAVVVVVDAHGEAEGNDWKAGRCWDPETFGLVMWGCPSAHACHPWENHLVVVNHYPEVAPLAYWVGPRRHLQGPSLAFCIWTVGFGTRFSPESV